MALNDTKTSAATELADGTSSAATEHTEEPQLVEIVNQESYQHFLLTGPKLSFFVALVAAPLAMFQTIGSDLLIVFHSQMGSSRP